jgi:electron transfer flavoprotein beta subunit
VKIVVLVKQVPDTETKIKLGTTPSLLDESEFKYMVNPYDEFAIEEAVRTQEKFGGESVVIALGPTRVQEAMRKAMAMGVDKGVWINTDGLTQPLDSVMVAKALAQAISQENPDVIFAGQKAIDDDAAHVGPMVAECLNIPHVTVATKVEWLEGGKSAKIDREVESGMVETYQVQTPVLVGAHKSLNEPRFATLPGIMKAKKKPLAEIKWSDVKPSNAFVTQSQYLLPAEKAPGKIFKGEPLDQMVSKVVSLLRSEAKVI